MESSGDRMQAVRVVKESQQMEDETFYLIQSWCSGVLIVITIRKRSNVYADAGTVWDPKGVT